LARLPVQNQRRTVAAAALDEAFRAIPGCEPIRPHPANTQRTYYHYAVRLDLEVFSGRPIEVVCDAVSAEIGFWVKPPYQPLSSHPLCRPDRHILSRRIAASARVPAHSLLPEAHRQVARTLTVHHSLLLAELAQVRVLAAAVDKVRRYAHLLEAGS
jgi:dTDP-4-amino-4,6-dideoxygalactose transaminase